MMQESVPERWHTATQVTVADPTDQARGASHTPTQRPSRQQRLHEGTYQMSVELRNLRAIPWTSSDPFPVSRQLLQGLVHIWSAPGT